MNGLTSKQKKELTRIGIALLIFAVLMILRHTHLIPEAMNHGALLLLLLLIYLVPYYIAGNDVIRKCLHGIANKQLFDESFLMTLATVGAFACGEYEEAVAVMLFYQVGEFFQSYAVGKSRRAISDLMSIAPDYANRESGDGSVEVIDPDDIEPDDILVIKPGERIPTDSIVIEGEGLINTSALTGESLPRFVSPGDDVISGCINGDDLLRVRAVKAYEDSTVMQILELVEEAASKKSRTENFITRFAKWYTPAVVAGAVFLAFIPPLASGHFAAEFGKWVLRACTFLVISCPCALVISVPLAFFGGIGAAGKQGMLVKGSNYLEMMAHINTVVSDKTGTLTEGRFRVVRVIPASGYSDSDIIRYAAAVESGTTHPIGAAIREACTDPFPADQIKDIQNITGRGMTAVVAGDKIIIGNKRLLDEEGIGLGRALDAADDGIKADRAADGTVCYAAKNGEYIGMIVAADMPKAEAKAAIAEMKAAGVRRVVMLTGDSEASAGIAAEELGLTEYRAELLPQDKVETVEELITETSAADPAGKLAFIGDGINDAPVLSRADIGIAMGTMGSDAAIEAADIVIMDDKLSKIPAVIKIARKTIGISNANIAFALFVKFSCLLLGAIGVANMWFAVFADVGVAVICILNSMRMIVV